jgi:hypothetical protein
MREENIQKLRKVIEEKGIYWVIAAIIDGSIGYHTVYTARSLIKALLEGRRYVTERTVACFRCDESEEVVFDIRNFERLEQRDPERVRELIEFVKKMERLDPIQQLTISLMYP